MKFSFAPCGGARVLLAVVAFAAASVAGCGPAASPAFAPSSPAPSSPGSSLAPTSPAEAPQPGPGGQNVVTADVSDSRGRRTTVTLTSTTGASLTAPLVTLTDGTVAIIATLADDDSLSVTVMGARWAPFPDGSATLTDDTVAHAGGTRPTAADDNGVRRTTTRTRDGGRTLVVSLDPPAFPASEPSEAATTPAPEPRTTVKLTITRRALVSATWADDIEGGRSLQVNPTAFGRSGSAAALAAVRTELVASHTEAGTTVMDHQLRCHALGAPGKPTWNLEPWRPEVGYLDYLLARCNPS